MATYAEIVQRVIDYTHDDSAEFAAIIPDFITAAEQELNKSFPTDAKIRTYSDTLVIGQSAITKPDNWRVTLSILVKDSNFRRYFLERRSYSYLMDFQSNDVVYDRPKYYAEFGNDLTEWVIAPPADATYTVEVRQEEKFFGLTPSNTTTYLSLNHDDLLFYQILIEASRFHKAVANLGFYTQERDRLLQLALNEIQEQKGDATNINRSGR
jgi:hypothetical protein